MTLDGSAPVDASQVPSDVVAACQQTDDPYYLEMDVGRSKFERMDGTFTLTSNLAANLNWYFDNPAQSYGGSGGTVKAEIVNDPTSGAVCADPVENGFGQSDAKPGVSYSFTIWVVFPNVVSPTSPTGQGAIAAVNFSVPLVNIASGGGASVNAVSGPGFLQCEGFGSGAAAGSLFFPVGSVQGTCP